jgi:hypothetical protein
MTIYEYPWFLFHVSVQPTIDFGAEPFESAYVYTSAVTNDAGPALSLLLP